MFAYRKFVNIKLITVINNLYEFIIDHTFNSRSRLHHNIIYEKRLIFPAFSISEFALSGDILFVEKEERSDAFPEFRLNSI